jgi:tyrosyl-tRNA synthetase
MENPVTGELMSKSKGTGIFLDTTANEKFGQIMSQSDEMTKVLLVNCTLLPLPDIDEIMKAENPRDAKLRLAKEIVTIYHGTEEAEKAQQYFIDTFSKKQIPTEIKEQKVEWCDSLDSYQNLIDFIVSAGLATSRSDARRKMEQGGLYIDGVRTVESRILTPDDNGKVVQVGKKDFVKIVFP